MAVVGLSAAGTLALATAVTVKSVEASATGAGIVLEATVDGAVQTVSLTVDAATGFASGAGTVLSTTVVAGGLLLSEGGRAVAFVPSEVGRLLTHHERLTE